MIRFRPGQPRKSANPSRPDLLLVFVAGTSLVPLVCYILFTNFTHSRPSMSYQKDFLAFYTATRIARQEGYAQIYNMELERQAQEKVIGEKLEPEGVLLFLHTPLQVVLLVGVAGASYTISFLIWMVFLSVVILISLALLADLLPFEPRPWRLLFSGSLLSLPVYYAVLSGQDVAFLLLGLAIFLWGMDKKRETLAGIGLSLMTVRPQFAILLVIPLWFWSRRAFRAYILASGALALTSMQLVGQQGVAEFLELMHLSASGKVFATSEIGMLNLLGLALRIFPALDPTLARQAAWWIFMLSLAGTAALFAFSRLSFERKFGLAILVYLLTSPHLHYYELVFLLVPGAILVREGCKNNPAFLKTAALLASIAGILMAANFANPPLHNSLPYVVYALLISGLLRLREPAGFPIISEAR